MPIMRALLCMLLLVSSSTAWTQQELSARKDQFCEQMADMGQKILMARYEGVSREEVLQANQEATEDHQIANIHVFVSQMMLSAYREPWLQEHQRAAQFAQFYADQYQSCRNHFIDATVDPIP